MTGRYFRGVGTSRVAVLAVCLCLLAVPMVAAGQSVASDGTSPGSVGVTANTTDATAGSTTVRLDPTTATVDEGETRTLDVVVANADGGVGAVSGEISVVESEYADIVGFELRGDPGLENVTVTDDAVTFDGALMDTADTGLVTVAEVTVRGQLEGTTDLALSIDSLGDESGDPYDVGGTPDTALTVENSRNDVALSVTADADNATLDESITFTVMRTDSNARVEANVTVGNRTVDTGVDGEVTVVVRESMISDAGTVTAVASKPPTNQERYRNDSVTLSAVGDRSGPNDDGTGSGGVIVRTDPGSIDLSVGETTTVDVVVTNADGGVGAGNLTVTLTTDSSAEITNATVTGDPGIGGAEIRDRGTRVAAEFALRDGADEAPARIVELTLQGVSTGSTALSLSISSLGDESGNSYGIASAPDSGIDVHDDGSTDDESTDTVADGEEAGTATERPSATPTTAGTSDGESTVATTEGSTADTAVGSPADDGGAPTDAPLAVFGALAFVVVSLFGLLAVAGD
ncbi:hypothetical protein [Halolamina sediminis]|jgi:hypothetical protein|uniref:hypothetical protein n=1 Tax=Halolamina sediminis TaxID=1480675 RepID=UPI0006B55364|nr:hypothetical protein [Halolamina sediminis]